MESLTLWIFHLLIYFSQWSHGRNSIDLIIKQVKESTCKSRSSSFNVEQNPHMNQIYIQVLLMMQQSETHFPMLWNWGCYSGTVIFWRNKIFNCGSYFPHCCGNLLDRSDGSEKRFSSDYDYREYFDQGKEVTEWWHDMWH